MRERRFVRLIGLLLLASSALGETESGPRAQASKPVFTFREVAYYHRWSQNDQHEFTPEKQEDLEHWSDMITLNGYPDVREGEGLAARANAVLENYKNHRALVLKTTSIPRTPEREAEHLIVVAFGQPSFIEIAFARLKVSDGAGCSIVYSHRIYGGKIGDAMSGWLNANGPAIEKALMEWRGAPSPALLRQELGRTKT